MEPDRVANKGIGHVPEGREVFPFLSVQENLEMGAFGRRDSDGIAEDLETVSIISRFCASVPKMRRLICLAASNKCWPLVAL